jgi:acetolactate synthase-1/2/3 large subunit
VERSREFRTTLETAFAEKGPSLVVAPVDYRENRELTRRLGEIIGAGIVGG